MTADPTAEQPPTTARPAGRWQVTIAFFGWAVWNLVLASIAFGS